MPVPELAPLDLLGTAVIVLATAVLIVPVFQRLRLSAVLGYLAAGAAIGPHGLGVIEDTHGTMVLAEFGIVFLLFTLGLELSVERLTAMRRLIFGLGATQVGLCALAIGSAAWALGVPPEIAVIAGAALAQSSTVIVLQILSERGELVARLGRVSFAVLLFQDLVVAPILVLVPLLAADSNTILPAIGLAAVKAVVAVTLLVLIGRLLLRPVFRIAARSGNREVFVALVLLAALGTGWATQYAGLSTALGAFLAGVLLAGTEFRHQIEADTEPYRGLLLGLFFMTIGMMVDPAVLTGQAPVIGGIVMFLIVIKGAVIMALARAFGIGPATAVQVGLLLAGAGEFAFVIVGLARSEGLMAPDMAQALIVAVAVTMALTPILAAAGRRLGRAIQHHDGGRLDELAEKTVGLRDHVVICGYGRVGQTVAALLAGLKVPHIALDLDNGRVAEARHAGASVFYGNAAQLNVLRAAGVARAKAVVVTIDQPRMAERIVSVLRRHFPTLHILARAHDRNHGKELETAGATRAVPETLEASLQLGRAVLIAVDTPIEDIRHTIQHVREERYAGFEDIIPPSRPAAPASEKPPDKIIETVGPPPASTTGG